MSGTDLAVPSAVDITVVASPIALPSLNQRIWYSRDGTSPPVVLSAVFPGFAKLSVLSYTKMSCIGCGATRTKLVFEIFADASDEGPTGRAASDVPSNIFDW